MKKKSKYKERVRYEENNSEFTKKRKRRRIKFSIVWHVSLREGLFIYASPPLWPSAPQRPPPGALWRQAQPKVKPVKS